MNERTSQINIQFIFSLFHFQINAAATDAIQTLHTKLLSSVYSVNKIGRESDKCAVCSSLIIQQTRNEILDENLTKPKYLFKLLENIKSENRRAWKRHLREIIELETTSPKYDDRR